MMSLGLDAAFAPIRHDILSCNLPIPAIREAVEENPEDWVEGTVVVVRLGGEDGWLFPFTEEDSDVDRILLMADHAQEWVIENDLWPAETTNWPRCPEHPDSHPLETENINGQAAWVCPASHGLVTEIGSFYPLASNFFPRSP